MPKRILQGVVVSDKNDKTIVVLVERRLRHPVLKKTVRLLYEILSNKYYLLNSILAPIWYFYYLNAASSQIQQNLFLYQSENSRLFSMY